MTKNEKLAELNTNKKMLSILTIAVGENFGKGRGKKSTAFLGNKNLHYKCPIKNFNINNILVL